MQRWTRLNRIAQFASEMGSMYHDEKRLALVEQPRISHEDNMNTVLVWQVEEGVRSQDARAPGKTGRGCKTSQSTGCRNERAESIFGATNCHPSEGLQGPNHRRFHQNCLVGHLHLSVCSLKVLNLPMLLLTVLSL
jgi:hypothetical protein